MATYKAVFNGNTLYHVNNLHNEKGQFDFGDGDGDGIIDDHHNQRRSTGTRTTRASEYKSSVRYKTDSEAARERLDSYYKTISNEDDYSTKTGPSGGIRSANPYVDKDGNLTKAGEARLASELKANARKPKDKRIKDEDTLIDPKKWVQDDIKNLTEVAKNARDISKQTSDLVDKAMKDKPNDRLDLSNMTDQQIKAAINRELDERRYNELFNPPTQNKAKEFVKQALEVGGIITSNAVSALTIALLITQIAAA